ncbi:hypothetical protein Pint_26805 [Pistacia integerrima]|uniref:Uncharacterized protein n=1 Tax=Pistacia integerrima TaxID=434235 RepID=A0ACC0YTF7_9ROSI|nr:hypothetical protein Pint_26805 [Pistacia integerrima]
MLWTPPALPFAWNPSQKGVQHSAMELRPQLSTTSSYTLWLQKLILQLHSSCSLGLGSFRKLSQQVVGYSYVLARDLDIIKLEDDTGCKEGRKTCRKAIEKPLKPPENGILIPQLVLIAYEVLDAWKSLSKGIAHLLHVILVYGCR